MKPINELLNLGGQVAIITGGAMGIGKGIVNRLHEAGAYVVIADVDDAAAKTAADELNAKRAGSVLAIHVDVSSVSDVNKMVQAAASNFGSVDILVNNAGIYPAKSLRDMVDEDFKKVLDVNLHGAYLCTKYASEQMISQGRGGKIINITSIDALHPSMVGLAHYDASKHGLWGLTKNVALELAQHKIWVNAVAPGGITTPGVAKMQGPVQPGVNMKASMDTFLAKIPMHRMGDPDEIGKVVLFLASGMASYMTGSQIVVDGGALLS